MREWENSGDISKIYKLINKHKKYIKNKIIEKNLLIKSKTGDCIHPDNLMKVLQDLMPNTILSKTQWKMIVNIGKSKSFESLIDINNFFRLIEITSMNLDSHPNIYMYNKNKAHKLSYSVNSKYHNVKTEININMNNTQRDKLHESLNDFRQSKIKKNSKYIDFSKTTRTLNQ